jgi:hypothetical protein
MSQISPILTILALATITEALVEYLVRPLLDNTAQDVRRAALRYTATLIAVILCVVYRADLLVLMGLSSPIPVAGRIVTGLLIARGSNWLNDFVTRWLQ